jgi:uncharacterized protein (DUF952 family)
MTMDLYGHLIDQNLWDAAKKVGGITGASRKARKVSDVDASEADGL